MRFPNLVLQIIALGLLTSLAVGQGAVSHPAARDQRVVTIVTEAVNAAGGPSIASLKDFKASGQITYFWAGQEVKGDAEILAKGASQFRLDANLPEGSRLFVVDNGKGSLKHPSGQLEAVPAHNTLNVGTMMVPIIQLAAALHDDTMQISYVGQETKEGHEVHHIRLQQIFGNSVDDPRSRLTKRDFFIDTKTFEIVSTMEMRHPTYQSGVDYPHEMQFSDYRAVDGLSIPFSINEVTSGQRTFTVHLNSFSVNQGLGDEHFRPQL